MSAVGEMVRQGLASGRVEVWRVGAPSGEAFDAQVAEAAAVEGGEAPWLLEQKVAWSW